MRPLLTIGEFAQRCGLSRSALRFYDQNDLVRPRLVDEQTGYRYYAVSQVRQAALVRRLRAAEMPVDVVRRYLTADADERRDLLDRQLASFRERAAAVQAAVDQLGAELAGGDAGWCTLAPARLAQALRQVSFAVADPAERVDLGGVWIETRADSLRMVSTDSYRLAVSDLMLERIGPVGLQGMLDATHLGTLIADLEAAGDVTIGQDATGALSVTVAGRRAMVGGAGEDFPDYQRILDELPAGRRITVSHPALTQALAQLPADGPHLRLDFLPDRLALRTAGREVAVAGSWTGAALRMFVDARFFAEAVTAIGGPDLVLEARAPLQPFTLRSADRGTFRVLTMPVRPPTDE